MAERSENHLYLSQINGNLAADKTYFNDESFVNDLLENIKENPKKPQIVESAIKMHIDT